MFSVFGFRGQPCFLGAALFSGAALLSRGCLAFSGLPCLRSSWSAAGWILFSACRAASFSKVGVFFALFSPTFHGHSSHIAFCGIPFHLRHPRSIGWGVYGCFYPYLPEAPLIYRAPRHPLPTGWGVFRTFLPYLGLPPSPVSRIPLRRLRFAPGQNAPETGPRRALPDRTPIWYGKRASAVRNLAKPHNGTAKPGFPVRNGLAVASRTAEGRFLHETTPQEPRVQQKAVFCTKQLHRSLAYSRGLFSARNRLRAHRISSVRTGGREQRRVSAGTGGRWDTATLPLVYCLVVLGLPDLDLVAVGGLVAHPLGEILGGG